jgi:hypothetical protein
LCAIGADFHIAKIQSAVAEIKIFELIGGIAQAVNSVCNRNNIASHGQCSQGTQCGNIALIGIGNLPCGDGKNRHSVAQNSKVCV